ncbi:hypothetical protein OC25_01915 [Pedobacter kyungheensis]|uniref:Lipopolysaccharide biosynthesis protein n=1 Tax=Pedobacter kyungheensis TaxID=1069985 RepID=A0A0C1G8U7_9SPHI|nr:hypothetical protein [Pedobacter kyungheensis]KIA96529.1 hypothetical protein OC25_01915 [Pedobacter kyungheensis]
MNIQKSLDTVIRYRWIIIAIFILTIVVSFFVLRNLPKDYKSEAKLSTGLLDPSRQLAPDRASYTGPDIIIKLNQQFSTIMDIMRMPKNISLLSYRLILHDLKDEKSTFKPWSAELKALTDAQRQESIAQFEDRLNKKQVLTPLDNGKIKLYQLVTSMGYDEKSLNKKLDINHEQNSDFISVAYTSNNTLLSVFVVNTLSRDFINNYSLEQILNKNTAIVVLDSLLKKKEAVMNERIKQLKDYKIRNGVLNLDKQSQIVYQQITDNENKRNQALIDRQAAQAALKSVNDKLASRTSDKYLGAEVIEDNRAIINLKNKVQAAEDNYLRNGYKPADKKTVDSLQVLLSSRLVQSNDQYVSDPLIAKQSLVQRRISLGIEVERATAGINDIDKELAKLNAKFTGMVPFDAGVSDYERNADVATKEYLEILARYNQTSLDKNVSLRLQLVQEGIPTLPESSKKLIYMALSAIASFAICFCTIFLISVLDHSVNNGAELKSELNAKLIGELDFIRAGNDNIAQIWSGQQPESEYAVFRNQLRALRFELDNQLFDHNEKVLGLTGFGASGSQSFTVLNLAYAFAQLNKKVLLIGNQEVVSALQKLKVPVNQSLKAVLQAADIAENKPFTFVSNDLNGQSLLEIKDREGLSSIFTAIKDRFDLIIVALDSLEDDVDNREWMSFIGLYAAIFVAGSALHDKQKKALATLNGDENFAGWIVTSVKQK